MNAVDGKISAITGARRGTGRGRALRVRGFLAATLILAAAACSGNGGERATKTAPDAKPVRVLSLNVLHGLFCPAETDFCHAPDRAEMVARGIERAGCPELIGFQEIGPRQEEVVPASMARVCGGRYKLAWQGVASPDREMVFTTLPILDRGYLDLAAFPWEAYWVRVDSSLGAVDFLTTHLASSANNPPCRPGQCPAVCPEGITTNECNAIEVLQLLTSRPPGAAVTIASGDFNAMPGDPTLTTFTKAGFVDAWLAAGNPECAPATGAGCTAGRERPENPLDGLDVADGRYAERIDFVLARPASTCALDTRAHGFADKPLDPPFRGLYWPSDHGGVLAEIRCS